MFAAFWTSHCQPERFIADTVNLGKSLMHMHIFYYSYRTVVALSRNFLRACDPKVWIFFRKPIS